MKQSKPRLLLSIFLTMFYIGAFTFGGGLSMIPQMSRVFVTKRRWVRQEDVVDLFAVAQSLPGAVAINASTLVGYRLCGTAGALAAALASVLPSFLLLTAVTVFYDFFLENPVVMGVLRGVRAAVIALLFSAVWQLRKDSLKDLAGLFLFLAALALSLLTGLNPIWLILGGVAAGLALTLLRTRRGGKEAG